MNNRFTFDRVVKMVQLLNHSAYARYTLNPVDRIGVSAKRLNTYSTISNNNGRVCVVLKNV